MAKLQTRRELKLIHPFRVEEPTQAQWTIVERMPLRAIIVGPLDCEPVPLGFGSREQAREWTKQQEWAKNFNWDALKDPQGHGADGPTAPQKGITHSLTLWSEFGCTGLYYDVPAEGVADWGARLPLSAAVPTWMPRSCESSGLSDLSGSDYGEPSGEIVLVLAGDGHRFNLPFPVLDSTNTD
jgi:hypothetical protein